MSVNWNNNAEDDTIVLQQTIIATGCTNIMILPIHVSNYLSPDICSIIRKPNSNILVCSDTTDGIQYQWGYTVKATQQEVYINGATLQYVLLPHNFDTTLYIYWVTTYYNYPSQSCYTKSYFNNAIISSTSVEQFDNPIKVYPIPCADVLHIDFPYRDIILNKTRLSIKSLSGSIIFQKESLDEKHQKIDIIPFPNGVYLLEIISENYQSIHKIIIQQQ